MKNREMYKDKIMKALKDAPVEDGAICDFMREAVFPTQNVTGEEHCRKISCTDCSMVFAFWLDEEYVEPEPPKPEVDWYHVPVDTLVRVRDSEDEEWMLQYFKSISDTIPTHRFEAWDDGRTSKTTDWIIKHWKYCELVEDEDDCN